MQTLPGSRTPGVSVPGESERLPNPVVETGVAVDATGTTTTDTGLDDDAEVEAVIVTSTAQDFDFNVSLGGNDLFATEQSPSAAVEKFSPEQNVEAGAGLPSLDIDVSAASASGGATADVTVVLSHDSL